MCGINFIYSKNTPLKKGMIEQMMAATSHRGPDFSNYIYINNHVAIAHNRLSIIDLSAQANQPLVVENRYYLSFNGEIYNYKELKNELEAEQIQFNTNSDSEVLLKLLIAKGQKGIELLKGMFAFVFFDSQENTIIASRDYYGIKPLYYFENNEYFIISSESSGILASHCISKKINTDSIISYLNFKYIADNTTFYQGIKSLKAGSIFGHKSGQTSISSIDFPFIPIDSSTYNTLEKHITSGISHSLVSDVPIGLFLSGGVDSCLIYHTLKKYHNIPIICFYINIDNDLEEQKKIESLVKSHQDELIIVDLNKDFETNFQTYITTLNSPIADSGGFLNWLLSKEAKKKDIKVVLSGAGGDELFTGYNRHRAFFNYLTYKNSIPFSLLKKLPFEIFFRGDKKRLIKKLINDCSTNSTQTWSNFIRLSLPLKTRLSVSTPISTLTEAVLHDQTNYLVKDVLAISDQASMANSIEMRLPLLYHKYTIDFDKFMKKGRKWILKKIVDTPSNNKKGFGVFLSESILDLPYFSSQLKKIENPEHYIYNYLFYSETQRLISAHRLKKNNYSPEIWALITLISWMEHMFPNQSDFID